MGNSVNRLDTGERAFFSRQLEHTKTKTYDTKYAPLKAMMLLPVSMEASNGDALITYRSFSKVGRAAFISDFANDLPPVDVFGEEVTIKVKDIGVKYQYSIMEIRRAQRGNLDLDTKRVRAAQRAVDELLNRVAWTGDTKTGLQGFLNHPNITEYTVPAGASTTKTWVTKTPDEIVADMAGIVSDGVINPTNGKESPNILLLPISQYEYIQNTRMGGSSDTTIMTFFMKNNQHIEMIDWLPELKGIGAGGTDRMIVYPMDSDTLTFEVPQMFEIMEEDKKGMAYEVPCHAQTAGMFVYYPQAVAYGDGI